jgi:hypothetical protein
VLYANVVAVYLAPTPVPEGIFHIKTALPALRPLESEYVTEQIVTGERDLRDWVHSGGSQIPDVSELVLRGRLPDGTQRTDVFRVVEKRAFECSHLMLSVYVSARFLRKLQAAFVVAATELG